MMTPECLTVPEFAVVRGATIAKVMAQVRWSSMPHEDLGQRRPRDKRMQDIRLGPEAHTWWKVRFGDQSLKPLEELSPLGRTGWQ
jgi:hypothetical protein